MKTVIRTLFICFILFTSCKKESSTKHCWQLVDNAGNNLAIVCNKTESQLIACVNNSSCGSFVNGGSISNCNYYNTDGDRFCWKIGTAYLRDLTEGQAAMYARCYYSNATPVKTDCSFACTRWYHREKRTYKPTSNITYSTITFENFCGDTLTTLYQGRQIVRKDDADSLIVIQFSNNGTNW
jgi:hypothetical protein